MNVVVVGGSRIAFELARQLSRDDDNVVLVTADPERARASLADWDVVIVAGDPTDWWVLEDAGTREADVLVALTEADRRNLMACQLARKLGARRVVAMVQAPDSRPLFAALGIHAAVSGAEVLASLVRQQSEFDGVLAALAMHRGRLSIVQVRLPKDAPSVGCSLAQLALPQGSLVVALVREDQITVPNGTRVLRAHDEVLIAAHRDVQAEALTALLGAS